MAILGPQTCVPDCDIYSALMSQAATKDNNNDLGLGNRHEAYGVSEKLLFKNKAQSHSGRAYL